MKSFISLEEAIDILNENVNHLEKENVSIIKSINRIACHDIYSQINNPPFNKSAMDGYALNYKDTFDGEYSLNVIDEVFAGSISKTEITSGTAIRIMTGAPIPKGANVVVKQEDVKRYKDIITLNKAFCENENICFIGEDIKEGTLLVKKGKKLNYADIGILASAGISNINVYKKPTIAFISTGDELRDVNEELEDGKIYNSNKYSILARLEELNYEVSYISHVNDSYIEIGREIEKASHFADVVLTTGGASVGEKDLIKEAIDNINGEKLFWKIKIKPGSAMLVSKFKKTIVISLSGNPTAALTTFELVGRTTLEKLMGKEAVEINREKAFLINDFGKRSPQRRFLRGNVFTTEEGQFVEITQVKSGNGILSSTLNSNCLIELEAGNNGVYKGDLVKIIRF